MEREYKIDASSRHCHVCGRVFEVNEEYFSAVVETLQENLLDRHDFCGPCWKPPEGGYFSYWKTHVPEPGPDLRRGPRLIDMGRLMGLFEHLADSEEIQARRFRYVLALVLMRKRRLKVVESRRLKDGGEEMTLREAGTQRTHAVSAPPVTEDEIRSVTQRLGEVLDLPEKWDRAATADEANASANTKPESANDADPENATL